MVKRPKSPEIHEEARYFTVYQPYPLHANWILEDDQMKCAMWVAECIGVNHLWAIHYKPKARGMILLEVSRMFTDHGRLLGEHRWSETLTSANELEEFSATQVFHSFYTTGRDAQKDGWKAIPIPNVWFKGWVPGNGEFVRPYPSTHWCAVPVEDRTNKPICRPLPSELKAPPPLLRPKGQVVGSSHWVEKQVPPLDTAKANSQDNSRGGSPSLSNTPLSAVPGPGNDTKPSTPSAGAQTPLPPTAPRSATIPTAPRSMRGKPMSLNDFIAGPSKPKRAGWEKPAEKDKFSLRNAAPKGPVNAWAKKLNITPSGKTTHVRPLAWSLDQDMDHSGWDVPDPAPTSPAVSASVSKGGSSAASPAPNEIRLQPDQSLSTSIRAPRAGSVANKDRQDTNMNTRDDGNTHTHTHTHQSRRKDRGKGKAKGHDKDKDDDKDKEANEIAWKNYLHDFSSNAANRDADNARSKAKEEEEKVVVVPPPDPSNPGMLTPAEMHRDRDRNGGLRPWEKGNITWDHMDWTSSIPEKEKEKEKEKETEKGKGKGKKRERDGYKSSRRDRDKDRERDSHRDQDKDRDRDRDREKDGHRDKDRERRDRDKEREPDRDRDMDKDRDRDRDSHSRRDRDHDKDHDSHSRRDRDKDGHKDAAHTPRKRKSDGGFDIKSELRYDKDGNPDDADESRKRMSPGPLNDDRAATWASWDAPAAESAAALTLPQLEHDRGGDGFGGYGERDGEQGQGADNDNETSSWSGALTSPSKPERDRGGGFGGYGKRDRDRGQGGDNNSQWSSTHERKLTHEEARKKRNRGRNSGINDWANDPGDDGNEWAGKPTDSDVHMEECVEEPPGSADEGEEYHEYKEQDNTGAEDWATGQSDALQNDAPDAAPEESGEADWAGDPNEMTETEQMNWDAHAADADAAPYGKKDPGSGDWSKDTEDKTAVNEWGLPTPGPSKAKKEIKHDWAGNPVDAEVDMTAWGMKPADFLPAKTKKEAKLDWADDPIEDHLAAWGLTPKEVAPSPLAKGKQEEVKLDWAGNPIEADPAAWRLTTKEVAPLPSTAIGKQKEVELDWAGNPIRDDPAAWGLTLEEVAPSSLAKGKQPEIELDWAGNPLRDDPAAWGLAAEDLEGGDEQEIEAHWAGNPIAPDHAAWGINPDDYPDSPADVWNTTGKFIKEEELICPTHNIACKKGICRDMANLIRENKTKQRDRTRDRGRGHRGLTGRGAPRVAPLPLAKGKQKEVELDWAGNPIRGDLEAWGLTAEDLEGGDEQEVEVDWAGNPIAPDHAARGISPDDYPDSPAAAWNTTGKFIKEEELICPTHNIACKKGTCRDMANLITENNLKQWNRTRGKGRGYRGLTERGAPGGPRGSSGAKETQDGGVVKYKRTRRSRKTEPTHILKPMLIGTMRGFATDDLRKAKAEKEAERRG